LAPEAFPKERLISTIHQFEPSGTPYDEVHILMISSEREARIMGEAWVETEKALARRRKLTEEFVGTAPIVAEYHRIKRDAVLWFTAGNGTAAQVIVAGGDPYEVRRAPIPFSVIRNNVQIHLDGDCLRRNIVVLVCPENYRGDSVISLWRSLGDRFPVPDELWVDVSPNASELQNEMMGEYTMEAIYPFVLRGELFSSKCRGTTTGSALYIRSKSGIGPRYSFSDGSGKGGEWRKLPER
jgi:hypothetical protein